MLRPMQVLSRRFIIKRPAPSHYKYWCYQGSSVQVYGLLCPPQSGTFRFNITINPPVCTFLLFGAEILSRIPKVIFYKKKLIRLIKLLVSMLWLEFCIRKTRVYTKYFNFCVQHYTCCVCIFGWKIEGLILEHSHKNKYFWPNSY